MNEEPQTYTLDEAVEMMIDQGRPPDGFAVRMVFSQNELRDTTHPVSEALSSLHDKHSITVEREVRDNGKLKLLVLTATWFGKDTDKLVTTLKDYDLELQDLLRDQLPADEQPSFQMGFLHKDGENDPAYG